MKHNPKPCFPLPSFGESGAEKMAVNDSLSEFLTVAVDAAKSAGVIIVDGFHRNKNVEHKGQVDLVTETDKDCEDLIFNHLKKHYPEHKFIGEETSAACGTAQLTDHPTWIVDPLDGTTNFVHGFPFVCVSIGLTIGKVPTVGVVYNPILNELFTATRGQGAFLNGAPIKVSSQTELMKSLLATEAQGLRAEVARLLTVETELRGELAAARHEDAAEIARLREELAAVRDGAQAAEIVSLREQLASARGEVYALSQTVMRLQADIIALERRRSRSSATASGLPAEGSVADRLRRLEEHLMSRSRSQSRSVRQSQMSQASAARPNMPPPAPVATPVAPAVSTALAQEEVGTSAPAGTQDDTPAS